MSKDYQVIIIGAGAAGLMCAATAAKRGLSVLVLDHANKMAKKVLMSGGGRCNFTNQYVEPDNFISNNPHFCKSALSRYTQWDFISLVEKHGIEYYEKSLGQLFCKESSRDIRDLLLVECQESGAKIQLKCHVEAVLSESPHQFVLKTNIGDFHSAALVIATGGLSIPTMGASGFGYQIAQQFGHTILETRAGLSPLAFTGSKQVSFADLAGNAINVQVSCNGASFNEAMLFTHKGLSGPAILQISSYWRKGDPLSINLLPQIDIRQWISENQQSRPDSHFKTLLATQFSQSVAAYFSQQIGINCKLKQIDHAQLEKIVNFLSDWTIFPNDVEGYRVAEVTLGGVDTSEISSKSFESLRHAGLFFIGEVLDVTGHLGGYNFQWAWASGHAAGSAIASS